MTPKGDPSVFEGDAEDLKQLQAASDAWMVRRVSSIKLRWIERTNGTITHVGG